jgi:Tol biopolymer transport system component
MIVIVATLCVIVGGAGCDGDDGARLPIPLPIPSIDADPTWSPDGQAIAFFHTGITSIDYETGRVQADPDSQGIWIVKPDGSEKHMLLRAAQSPAWAPDSRWLCVIDGGHIWKLKADGDSLTQLTYRGSHSDPSWSPCGQLIASSVTICTPSDPCGLWLTQTIGKGSFWLLHGSSPNWAPDGESILYVGSLDDERGMLSYYLASTSSQMVYPIGQAHVTSDPEYSHDGSRIAIGLDFHIWIMNSSGSGSEQLTSVECYGSISWSPDGTQIAYAPGDGLWIIDADGSDAHQITFPPN